MRAVVLLLLIPVWATIARGAPPPVQPASPEGMSAETVFAPPPSREASRAKPAPGDARVCEMIEASAVAAAVDPSFLARLIWRESLFDPAAVSPKGARGIAQFIPSTAALRELEDPFDAEAALSAAAAYLAELTRDFGNIGLAAVAYNAGEARAARYKATGDMLPAETLAYVDAITGRGAEEWRLGDPEADLALVGPTFQAGCLALAATRGNAGAIGADPLPPWGVVITTNRDRAGARRQVDRLRNRLPILAGERIAFARSNGLGRTREMIAAQVGRDTREAAEAFCADYRAKGGDCVVLRNRSP